MIIENNQYIVDDWFNPELDKETRELYLKEFRDIVINKFFPSNYLYYNSEVLKPILNVFTYLLFTNNEKIRILYDLMDFDKINVNLIYDFCKHFNMPLYFDKEYFLKLDEYTEDKLEKKRREYIKIYYRELLKLYLQFRNYKGNRHTLKYLFDSFGYNVKFCQRYVRIGYYNYELVKPIYLKNIDREVDILTWVYEQPDMRDRSCMYLFENYRDEEGKEIFRYYEWNTEMPLKMYSKQHNEYFLVKEFTDNYKTYYEEVDDKIYMYCGREDVTKVYLYHSYYPTSCFRVDFSLKSMFSIFSNAESGEKREVYLFNKFIYEYFLNIINKVFPVNVSMLFIVRNYFSYKEQEELMNVIDNGSYSPDGYIEDAYRLFSNCYLIFSKKEGCKELDLRYKYKYYIEFKKVVNDIYEYNIENVLFYKEEEEKYYNYDEGEVEGGYIINDSIYYYNFIYMTKEIETEVEKDIGYYENVTEEYFGCLKHLGRYVIYDIDLTDGDTTKRWKIRLSNTKIRDSLLEEKPENCFLRYFERGDKIFYIPGQSELNTVFEPDLTNNILNTWIYDRGDNEENLKVFETLKFFKFIIDRNNISYFYNYKNEYISELIIYKGSYYNVEIYYYVCFDCIKIETLIDFIEKFGQFEMCIDLETIKGGKINAKE